MAVDHRGAAHHDMVSHRRRAGDPHARSHDAVFANTDVVAELNLIVELCAFTHKGVINRAAIDRRVGADFNVSAQYRAAALRDLDPLALKGCESETVTPQYGAGLHDAAVADNCAGLQDSIGINDAVPADVAVFPNIGPSADECVGPYFGTSLHHCHRLNGSSRIDKGALLHESTRMDAGAALYRIEDLRGKSKEGIRIVAQEHRAVRQLFAKKSLGIAFTKHNRCSFCRLHGLCVARIGQKAHVALACFRRRHKAENRNIRPNHLHFQAVF